MADDREPSADRSDADAAWERRRRRARVFGETLPETTSDERDPGTPQRESTTDRWLREQVPPHHGQ